MKLGRKDSKGPGAGDVPGVAQGRTLGLPSLWPSVWSWESQTHSFSSSLSPPAPTQGCGVLITFPMVTCDYPLGSQQVDIMKPPATTMPGLPGWTASSQTTSPKNFSPLKLFRVRYLVKTMWKNKNTHTWTHMLLYIYACIQCKDCWRHVAGIWQNQDLNGWLWNLSIHKQYKECVLPPCEGLGRKWKAMKDEGDTQPLSLTGPAAAGTSYPWDCPMVDTELWGT